MTKRACLGIMFEYEVVQRHEINLAKEDTTQKILFTEL